MFSLEKALGRTHYGLLVFKGKLEIDSLSRNAVLGTRDNGFKLKEEKFRLNIRGKFFTQRMVKHWNKSGGEVVDSPSLEVFKTRLNGATGSLR